MRASPTTHGVILWMEYEGDIYCPETSHARATRENVEDDIWHGEHLGVCHAVYSYGAYPNGGSYCRDVTLEVASSVARRSFEQALEPIPAVCAFLQAAGEEWFQERREGVIADRPMPVSQEAAPARQQAKSRKRTKQLSPEELRAQPQLKLPIAGGKSKAQGHARTAGKDAMSIKRARDKSNAR
jgi:hypothetical protein